MQITLHFLSTKQCAVVVFVVVFVSVGFFFFVFCAHLIVWGGVIYVCTYMPAIHCFHSTNIK